MSEMEPEPVPDSEISSLSLDSPPVPDTQSARHVKHPTAASLLLSTFLTLFVVPCVYSVFSRWEQNDDEVTHRKSLS